MSDESYVKTVFAAVSKQFKFRCRMKVLLRQFSPDVKTVQISMSDEIMSRQFSLLCQNSSNFDVR